MTRESTLPDDFKLPQEKRKRISVSRFLFFVVVMLVAGFIFIALNGCASAPQPALPLTMYVPQSNGTFQNAEDPKDEISLGDFERMKGFYLRPVDEIQKTNAIINQCVKWK